MGSWAMKLSTSLRRTTESSNPSESSEGVESKTSRNGTQRFTHSGQEVAAVTMMIVLVVVAAELAVRMSSAHGELMTTLRCRSYEITEFTANFKLRLLKAFTLRSQSQECVIAEERRTVAKRRTGTTLGQKRLSLLTSADDELS